MAETERCPHCGSTYAERRILSFHIPRCLQAPDVRARIVAILEDPDNPGCARGMEDYNRRAVACGVISASALNRHFGGWPNVCTEFGLQHVRYGSRKPQAQEVKPRPSTYISKVDRHAKEIDDELDHARRMVKEARVEWAAHGIPVYKVREIDGGRRLAWSVR